MGKNKLARWAELETFHNVIQPETDGFPGKDHRIKGNWKKEIFRNDNPIILELGCGKGEYTVELSILFPGFNFVGVDIKGARMWKGARIADERRLTNTAFLRTRIEFIGSFFAEDEVDEIWITFPDPHPGKKNSNKRLTCPWFLNTYRSFLKDRGIIHLKTDNTELFEFTERMAKENGLEIILASKDMHSVKTGDPQISGKIFSAILKAETDEHILKEILSIKTHYETKFLEQGMTINYISFRLLKNKSICHGWEKAVGE